MCVLFLLQDLYCVRSDLGNLLKALGRLEEAKVRFFGFAILKCGLFFSPIVLRFVFLGHRSFLPFLNFSYF